MIVGSAERIGALDAIKADMKKLADPRGVSASDLEAVINRAPVITWLIHGVHGNEISSGDAAIAEAYHLLAATNDPSATTILRESLVLIDPMQNPDGRARFNFQNLQGRAATPDSDPLSAEHDEPWPGGRSNHYLFDLNRDWLAITQPETAGRVKLFLEFFPQITVDLHEMGGDSTYYFPPAASPKNPFRTPTQTGWLEKFGRNNAARFDERGFAYFLREVFDSFYPGYGASWPMAQGSIAHTFEQASSRGLIYRRTDGDDLTFRDGVVQHFTAALRTALTAAENRRALLSDFAAFRKSASDEGGTKEYVLVPGSDPSRARRLASLLVAQGVQVFRSEEAAARTAATKTAAPQTAATKTGPNAANSYPVGSYIIPLGQPTSRLIRNLLDPDVAMDPEFLKKQEDRRARLLSDQFYDITTWSLPALFDVECVLLDVNLPGKRSRFDADRAEGFEVKPASVAYLIPWGSAAAAATAEAARLGVRVRVADDPFSLGGRTYGIGTAIIRVPENEPTLRATLQTLASKWGVEIVAANSGFVDEGGISLGSNQVLHLKAPRVLLMWDSPTSSLSAGWARYVLERRYNQPVTTIRVSTLRRVELRKFDVVVMPQGNYEGVLGDGDVARLKDFVRAGGTLVTIGEASRWASRDKVGLLSTDTELKDGRSDETTEAKKPEASKDEKKDFDYNRAITPEKPRPDVIAGAILRGSLDTEHWMSAGLDADFQVMVEGQRVFTPIKLDKGTNVGVYAAADRLAISGIVWKENKDSLAKKAFLIVEPLGAGHVIAFAEEPNFRAYSQASELLFMNAVLLGPAH